MTQRLMIFSALTLFLSLPLNASTPLQDLSEDDGLRSATSTSSETSITLPSAAGMSLSHPSSRPSPLPDIDIHVTFKSIESAPSQQSSSFFRKDDAFALADVLLTVPHLYLSYAEKDSFVTLGISGGVALVLMMCRNINYGNYFALECQDRRMFNFFTRYNNMIFSVFCGFLGYQGWLLWNFPEGSNNTPALVTAGLSLLAMTMMSILDWHILFDQFYSRHEKRKTQVPSTRA